MRTRSHCIMNKKGPGPNKENSDGSTKKLDYHKQNSLQSLKPIFKGVKKDYLHGQNVIFRIK